MAQNVEVIEVRRRMSGYLPLMEAIAVVMQSFRIEPEDGAYVLAFMAGSAQGMQGSHTAELQPYIDEGERIGVSDDAEKGNGHG